MNLGDPQTGGGGGSSRGGGGLVQHNDCNW